jgi:hypothetical protein
MTRSPDRDDRAVILRLAEQGVSVRKIAKITLWSRPTISKVLQQAGFDPTKGKLPTPLGASSAPEGSFNFEEEMRKVEEETRTWWTSLTDEERDRIIAQGPPEDRNTGGVLDPVY